MYTKKMSVPIDERIFRIRKIDRSNDAPLADWGLWKGRSLLEAYADPDGIEEVGKIQLFEREFFCLDSWPGEPIVWVEATRVPDDFIISDTRSFFDKILQLFFRV
jgi:hypothetical protein